MGGALILVSIAITTLLWADLTNRFVWVVLVVTLGFGAIGWVDDYRKVVHRNPKGLSARTKFFWQSVIGSGGRAFSSPTAELPAQTEFIVPFFKQVTYPLGVVGFVILTYFVIVGTSNAVNLTDGLDGLAIMPTVMVGSALGVFAYVAGNAVFSQISRLSAHPGRRRAHRVLRRAGGRGTGVSSGSTPIRRKCSWATSARSRSARRSASIAVIVRQEIVLFIMGGVFVVETLSVMLQVASFKLTGKRIFRMAPLHHHYELKGWKENQVVVRFWIITMMLVLFGLSTLKLR